MKKADLLLHPVRMRIVQQLIAGDPQAILQLAQRLGDVPQATLYRHMKLLLEADWLPSCKSTKFTDPRSLTLSEPSSGYT